MTIEEKRWYFGVKMNKAPNQWTDCSCTHSDNDKRWYERLNAWCCELCKERIDKQNLDEAIDMQNKLRSVMEMDENSNLYLRICNKFKSDGKG